MQKYNYEFFNLHERSNDTYRKRPQHKRKENISENKKCMIANKLLTMLFDLCWLVFFIQNKCIRFGQYAWFIRLNAIRCFTVNLLFNIIAGHFDQFRVIFGESKSLNLSMPSLDTWQWPLTDQLVQSGLINSTSWIHHRHGVYIIWYAFSSLMYTWNRLHDVRYSKKSWIYDNVMCVQIQLNENTTYVDQNDTFALKKMESSDTRIFNNWWFSR